VWSNKARTLTIGTRQGRYPGMLQSRRFLIVLPDGTSRQVDYAGAAVTVSL